jgi:hypothetical protein
MAILTTDITISATAQPVVPAVAGVSGQIYKIGVKALKANAADCFIGGSNVTTANGWPLSAGEGFSDDIGNARDLYVIGTASDHLRVMVRTK